MHGKTLTKFSRNVCREETAWGNGRYKCKTESRNRPGVAQTVPGGLGSRISWHSAREGGEVVSLTHRPPLPPGMFLVLIFTKGWVDSRAIVRSEGDMSLKNPVTPPGIDVSVTGRIVLKLILDKYNLRVRWTGLSYLRAGSCCWL
jgi:hypothetical protein